MIYEILQLEKAGAAELVDVDAQTDHDVLPSGRFVLIRDIRKALNGEDFYYFPPIGGKGILVKGIPVHTWNYYFTFFSFCQEFGLPHGAGWLNELPWVIDFLLFMKNIYKTIECWRMQKSAGVSNIMPEEVGL